MLGFYSQHVVNVGTNTCIGMEKCINFGYDDESEASPPLAFVMDASVCNDGDDEDSTCNNTSSNAEFVHYE